MDSIINNKKISFYKIDVCDEYCKCKKCINRYECLDKGVCERCGENRFFVGECDGFIKAGEING